MIERGPSKSPSYVYPGARMLRCGELCLRSPSLCRVKRPLNSIRHHEELCWTTTVSWVALNNG